MMRFFLAAALATAMTYSFGSPAFAGELDGETVSATPELEGTLVLRVDTRTNQTSFARTPAAMSSEAQAKALAKKAKFAKVPSKKMKSELDQDGGASSWYFYNPYSYNYYQPNCYWYGYNYTPYYSYSYGYYNYYYYGSWGSYRW